MVHGSCCIFSSTLFRTWNGGFAQSMVCGMELSLDQLYVKASISRVMKWAAEVIVGEAKRSTAIGRSAISSFSRDQCLHSGSSMKFSMEPVRSMGVSGVSGGVWSVGIERVVVSVLVQTFTGVPVKGSLVFPEPAPAGL